MSEMPDTSTSSQATGRHPRSMGRGRGRRRDAAQAQSHTLTLEEYEAQRQGTDTIIRDAQLAQDLNRQLNIADQKTEHSLEKDILTSMFSYTPKQEPPQSKHHRGGRNRGRGRRGRGRR